MKPAPDELKVCTNRFSLLLAFLSTSTVSFNIGVWIELVIDGRVGCQQRFNNKCGSYCKICSIEEIPIIVGSSSVQFESIRSKSRGSVSPCFTVQFPTHIGWR